jgi:UDP-N-acetylglucosamine diphosphorylase / glucose-1-phosphate thymidylyltransferase / UDP-N-acetylgalactosamine diphosphorylase / glucosamine-1-phosphate N-acetyltransferase / galactosamine-1-phosphate N-acetyltransferase
LATLLFRLKKNNTRRSLVQAVMMVAGKSTRTYPLTLTRPKPLLPIQNKPLLKHSLDQMVGVFDEVIFIVGYKSKMISDELGNDYRGIRLFYQEQTEQLGTGHAILQAKPFIKDKFVALNGDDLFAREDLDRLTKFEFGALAKKVADPSLYGVLEVDEYNKVLNLVEKPTTYLGDLANIGCYVFPPLIFNVIENTPKSVRGEIEITSSILTLSKELDCLAFPINGFWLPTGYPWDLLSHQEFIMEDYADSEIYGKVEPGAKLKGPVSVGKGTIIKSGVYIEGPVAIGANCQIGPNCAINKYTSIGNNCRIGPSVEIKNSIIMDNVNICHLSYIGDSIIGEGSILGAGTITANHRFKDEEIKSLVKGNLVNTERKKLGAIISDNVSTGINTSIYPGRKMWPNTTTRPGEIVDKDIVSPNFEW